jgi:hypothetical protein
MKRTFNYTGRIRIDKQNVQLDVENVGGTVRADGRIRFEEPTRYGPAACVLLYFRRGPVRRSVQLGPLRPEMRFSEVLPDFQDPEGVSVDVRVYDADDLARRLLGLARRIKGGSQDDPSRTSLLTTRIGDFELPVWRVDLDFDGGPYLEISKRCGDFRRLARSEEFLALVLPAVVREIAEDLLVTQSYDDDYEEEDDRPALWMRFLTSLPGVDEFRPDMDSDQRGELVGQMEAAFAREADVLRRGAKLLATVDEGDDDR